MTEAFGLTQLLQKTQSSQIEIAQSSLSLSLSLRASSASSEPSVATLLDYGAGNVRSVRNAIRHLGLILKMLPTVYSLFAQGYDPYAYGAAHDPSLYAHGAYAGYPQYPQQVRSL
ncbi:hypothetical protein LWI29_018675 [Acer saccharum]|uniref:Uncharacterized protein n=1 Tax=Acer saccharum TaxID=4024 RepID=A0AA39SXU5_ACESA|nr:hypothetical protein LWI29_018675 [Acer saccharum]